MYEWFRKRPGYTYRMDTRPSLRYASLSLLSPTTASGSAALHTVQRDMPLFCALHVGHTQYSTWFRDSNMHTTSSDGSPLRGRCSTPEKRLPVVCFTLSHSPSPAPSGVIGMA